MNLIAAFIWFTYWSEVIVTVAVSYGGYLLGMNVAKHGYRFNVQTKKIERSAEEKHEDKCEQADANKDANKDENNDENKDAWQKI